MTGQFDLTGRKALVTGSVTGIGRAITEALAQAGAAVVAHGLEGVGETAAQWRRHGFSVAESRADLADVDCVDRLRRDLTDWGTPDILVLNASVEMSQDWRQVELAAMTRQAMINLHAPLLLMQAFVPSMIEGNWGRVLAIGSVQEQRPNARHIAYATTKAGQTSLILNMARHVRASGVTFNVLKPGAIATDRTRLTLSNPQTEADIIARIPAGRIGVPDDCAGAALLLCSDAGAYINGAELTVDGGLRL